MNVIDDIEQAKAKARQTSIDDARKVLDWLEENPEQPLPLGLVGYSGTWTERIYPHYELAEAGPELRRANVRARLAERTRTMGTVHKVATDNEFGVEKRFGSLAIRVVASRELTCTAKVVGKQQVTKQMLVKPAVWGESTFDEDIVEWECEPILGE